MNVSLTPTLEEYVRRKVESGLYNTASEVVREALRNLMSQELRRKEIARTEIPIKKEIVAKLKSMQKLLRKHGVTSLSLFGSIVRGHGQPDSDIDVLVDIDPEFGFGLLELVSVSDVLEEHLGRSVDVLTRDSIAPACKSNILREAEKVF